ncbi:ATPase [Clostridia bacterium]|nr:ATPase [Clostridia bacterium]
MNTKMKAVIADVNSIVAEREELVECIAIALLTRKNLFILGDTGQAKSYAINAFRSRISGAKQFERLLSKQTDEEQLFGRIDLQSLIAGNPRVITDGKIPDSHIAFLDELFKCNDGVLNSLLTALNERKYTNEGQVTDIPTISFFAASNEIPNFSDPAEKILRPLYDRFDIKVVTRYVEDRQKRLETLKNKQTTGNAAILATITLDELTAMQDAVRAVVVPDLVNELMDDILCELRKAGVHVSDRKYFNYFPLAQAKAWLDGYPEVNPEHLMILKNYLWTTPEEITVIGQTLTRLCQNPLREHLESIRTMAAESLKEFNDAQDNKKALIKLRGEFVRLFDMLPDTTDAADMEKAKIEECLEALETMSREAHTAAGFTYANIAEIKALQ